MITLNKKVFPHPKQWVSKKEEVEKDISKMLSRGAIVKTKYIGDMFIGEPASDKFENSEWLYCPGCFEGRRLHMQDEPEGRILFSISKYFVYKISLVSLVRQVLQIPLPLLWSWIKSKNYNSGELIL